MHRLYMFINHINDKKFNKNDWHLKNMYYLCGWKQNIELCIKGEIGIEYDGEVVTLESEREGDIFQVIFIESKFGDVYNH